MSITVKPGDDIRWTGRITAQGVTDFTGYTLEGQVRELGCADAPGSLVGTASFAWLDEAGGVFRYNIDKTETALWPAPATLVLDIRIITPGGATLRTETATIATTPGVTA